MINFGMLRALIKKELLGITRDLHALGLLIGMPLIFIFILSVALDGLYGKQQQISLVVAVENLDGGEAARLFIDELKSSGLVIATPGGKEPQAAIRIPLGMSAAFEKLMQGDILAGDKIVIEPRPTLDIPWQWYLKAMAQKSIMQVLMVRLKAQLPEAYLPAAVKNMANIARPDQFFKEVSVGGVAPPSPLQINIPGWTVFAMFMIAMPLATGMVRECETGLTARLRATPVSESVLAWSQFLPGLVVSLIQFTVVMGASILVAPFVIDQPITLNSIGVSFVLTAILTSSVAVAFGVFVGRIARTAEQASTLSAGIVVISAALGGIMVPVFAMPPWLRTMAQSSPLYWSHQSLLAAMTGTFRWNVEGYLLFGLAILAMILMWLSRSMALFRR